MPLTWIDVLLALVILAWVTWEVRHDFGRALFDSVAMLFSMRVSLMLAPSVAEFFRFAGTERESQATALTALFVLFGIAALVGAKVLHESTQWTMESFDPVFGCLFGITSGVIMAHMIVRVAALFWSSDQSLPPFLADSRLGLELLTFKTYHQVEVFLANFRGRV